MARTMTVLVMFMYPSSTYARAYFIWSKLFSARSNLRPYTGRGMQEASPGTHTNRARGAARRRCKTCTGFSWTEVAKAVFDAYREEAQSAGFEVGSESFG